MLTTVLSMDAGSANESFFLVSDFFSVNVEADGERVGTPVIDAVAAFIHTSRGYVIDADITRVVLGWAA